VVSDSTRWVHSCQKTGSEDRGNLSKVVPRVCDGVACIVQTGTVDAD